ncbi:hypothetical protein VNI00_011823 [Paramarasmius palmivorus]|uniref:Uncharacterized protein n=1 Tax=Paramarasmius palmivorus TaxID=297713 RepID=A0AAW0C9R4_9AGAR
MSAPAPSLLPTPAPVMDALPSLTNDHNGQSALPPPATSSASNNQSTPTTPGATPTSIPPQPTVTTSTSLTPATSVPDPASSVDQESAGVPNELPGTDGEDDEDGDTKKTRGKPSHFSGACLAAMKKGLTREEFVEKTPAQVKALTQRQKNTYMRSMRTASATNKELYLQMVKDWILWQQNVARKSEGGTTAALFKVELEKKKKQIKPQFNHFVMKHPEYRDAVVGRSSETGRLDCLPSRAQAVKDLLEELLAEDVDSLKGEYNEFLEALDEGDNEDKGEIPADISAQQGQHKNFGSMAQDILNIWRKLTGLNLVLLAGECIDGDADYDSCVIFSKLDGCPDMDAGAGVDFNRFSNMFLHWLKDIYTKTHPDAKKPDREASNAPSLSSTTTPTSTPALSHRPMTSINKSNAAPEKSASCQVPAPLGNQSKQRSRTTKKAVRRDNWTSSEDTSE